MGVAEGGVQFKGGKDIGKGEVLGRGKPREV